MLKGPPPSKSQNSLCGDPFEEIYDMTAFKMIDAPGEISSRGGIRGKSPYFISALIIAASFISLVFPIPQKLNEINIERHLLFDFETRWQECAYTVHGTNPIDVLNGKAAVDPAIGPLPKIAGTAPWSYLLGNVFVAGFLPYAFALRWMIFIYVILTVATGMAVNSYLKVRDYPLTYRIAAVAGIYCNYFWLIALVNGNYSSHLCCLAIIMILIIDRHPKTAGLLHGLLMIKPQIAAIFYVAFFVKKKYSVIFTSALTVGIFWVAAGWLTHASPLQMLSETRNQGLHVYQGTYYGFFTFLQPLGLADRSLCMQLSMALGCLFVFYYCRKLTKTLETADNFLYYSIPAVASTFWCYKQINDFSILAIPTIAIVMYLANSRRKKETLMFFAALFVFYFHYPVLRLITKRSPVIKDYFIEQYLICFFWTGLLLLLMALEIACRRRQLSRATGREPPTGRQDEGQDDRPCLSVP
jgi:hypothetical protein